MEYPEEKKKRCCCFTGHRPEKLDFSEEEIKKRLYKEIQKAIESGITIFFTGMARGTDLWAGQMVLKWKKRDPEIKLVCVVPYPEFEKGWKESWQLQYRDIIENSDYKVLVSRTYHPGCFQKRNRWMVDHAGLVIAAYNGHPGGTRNTLLYAEKKKVKVRNILEEANLLPLDKLS